MVRVPVLEQLRALREEGAVYMQGTGLPRAGCYRKAFLLGELDSRASLVTPWRRQGWPTAHQPSCSSEWKPQRDPETCSGKPACGC